MKPRRKRTMLALALVALGSLLAAAPFLSWEAYCTVLGCFTMSREAFVWGTAYGPLSIFFGVMLALCGSIKFVNRSDWRLDWVEG